MNRKYYVLNIDLKDFFPSINFGRVRGMFMAFPYKRNPNVATVLAQICCFENQLPQGAPTSPVISNMICAKMDSELRRLAKENRCFYTRYADDVTFSTTLRNFPGNLATISPSGDVEIGNDLKRVIHQNGFKINSSKIRLQTKFQRQEVTGLTTNLFPNIRRRFVRQIRAMLYDWEVNGLDQAQQRYRDQFDAKNRAPFKDQPSFSRIVKGKIDFLGMVKGKDDPNYLRFLYKYARLNPNFEIHFEQSIISHGKTVEAVIYTEGKTDWVHLKNALNKLQERGKYSELALHFREKDEEVGDSKLVNMCSTFAMAPVPYPLPNIFIFDRDNGEALKRANLLEVEYHDWGQNVFSMKLPVPPHRKNTPEICIELLYKDTDLRCEDRNGRRLFLSDEFHTDSGRHYREDLVYSNRQRLRAPGLKIIDDDVFDERHRNVALSKYNFARYILEGEGDFGKLDISGFEKVFELILEITSKKRKV